MKNLKQKLLITQIDNKLEQFKCLDGAVIPNEGWVYSIRKALRMSLRQLGERLKMTPQSVKELEMREKKGSITLKSLNEAAYALDMKLVYGFVPRNGSLEKMIEKQAIKLATNIVKRASMSMKLEDQENSSARIEEAIIERAELLKEEIPRYLWD